MQDKQSEVAAVASAWSKQNPGKTKMEYGGDETQNLFEQVAAPPPSANSTRRDRLICDYCGKSHNEKIKLCCRCWCVAYCDKECQTIAWKGHKKVCIPKEPGDWQERKESGSTTNLGAARGIPGSYCEGKGALYVHDMRTHLDCVVFYCVSVRMCMCVCMYVCIYVSVCYSIYLTMYICTLYTFVLLLRYWKCVS